MSENLPSISGCGYFNQVYAKMVRYRRGCFDNRFFNLIKETDSFIPPESGPQNDTEWKEYAKNTTQKYREKLTGHNFEFLTWCDANQYCKAVLDELTNKKSIGMWMAPGEKIDPLTIEQEYYYRTANVIADVIHTFLLSKNAASQKLPTSIMSQSERLMDSILQHATEHNLRKPVRFMATLQKFADGQYPFHIFAQDPASVPDSITGFKHYILKDVVVGLRYWFSYKDTKKDRVSPSVVCSIMEILGYSFDERSMNRILKQYDGADWSTI